MRGAGAVEVGVAVAVDTTEAGSVARNRRTLPPAASRPAYILNLAVAGFVVRILRALTGNRVRGRAENLNLRQEEELIGGRLDRCTLAAGRGELIDLLNDVLPSTRELTEIGRHVALTHGAVFPTAAIRVRAIHLRLTCQAVSHLQGHTGLAGRGRRAVRSGACQRIMVEAHNLKGVRRAIDCNIDRVANADFIVVRAVVDIDRARRARDRAVPRDRLSIETHLLGGQARNAGRIVDARLGARARSRLIGQGHARALAAGRDRNSLLGGVRAIRALDGPGAGARDGKRIASQRPS